MAQIDLRNATIRISDGGVNYINIKIGEGNLEYTEKRQIEFVDSRGVLDLVRENKEEPVDVSFSFIWDYISGYSTNPPTIEDALKKRGQASSWASASADVNAPYAVNLTIIYVPPCSATGVNETIGLPFFNYTQLAHNLKDGTVACTGQCNIKQATAVRS